MKWKFKKDKLVTAEKEEQQNEAPSSLPTEAENGTLPEEKSDQVLDETELNGDEG